MTGVVELFARKVKVVVVVAIVVLELVGVLPGVVVDHIGGWEGEQRAGGHGEVHGRRTQVICGEPSWSLNG